MGKKIHELFIPGPVGRIETKYFKIQAGKVCGIEQEAIGTMNGKRFIELKLEMFIGATNPSDKIIIEGNQ